MTKLVFCILLSCLTYAHVTPHRHVLQLDIRDFGVNKNFWNMEMQLQPEPYIKLELLIQKVDHFNRDDHRYFHQRYFLNPSNYNNSGRIFLNVYGTGFIMWQAISDQVGFDWVVNAKHFGAFCFLLEHRYHGKSNVTLDARTENLKWLTIEQALADIEMFIFTMNAYQRFRNPKWIVFGGSYGGSLAAWSRLKFPHLITGAVTSGAAVEASLNFLDYLRVVREDLDSYDPRCVDNLANATREAERRIRERDALPNLMKMFRVCNMRHCDFSKAKHVSTFFYQLAVKIGFVAQYGESNIGSYAVDLTVPKFCEIMNNGSRGSVLQRYADAIHYILFYMNMDCIMCSYEDFVASYQNYHARDNTGRFYEYLSRCSQFGHSVTSDCPLRNPFSSTFSLPYFLELCMDIFGVEFSPQRVYRGIALTNARYGGKNFQRSNVVFVNGKADPFYVLGITDDTYALGPVIFMEGIAHCADTYPARAEDPPQVVAGRMRIREAIANWLS